MTQVRVTPHEDGSATLTTVYGDSVHVEGFKCDECGERAPFPVTHEYTARGATGRVCAVMWFCRPCGERIGAEEHTEECDHE